MKARSVLLTALTLLLSVTTLLVLAQSEPMANPECTAEGLGDAPAQIDQLYSDGLGALQDGDVRTWLDSLRELSSQAGSLRAFCDNYTFEGDAEGSASQVFGPVTFEPGIYTVTTTTDGFIIVSAEEIEGDCRLSVALSEGDANEGAQELFRVEDEPCTLLLEMSLLSEDWRVEIALVSSGD